MAYGLLTQNDTVIYLQSVGTSFAMYYLYAFTKHSTAEQSIVYKKVLRIIGSVNVILLCMIALDLAYNSYFSIANNDMEILNNDINNISINEANTATETQNKAESAVIYVTIIANFFNLIMYIAQIELLFKSLYYRDTDKLDVKLMGAVIVTAIFTVLYSLEIDDIYYALPNIVGMFISFLQFIAYAILKVCRLEKKKKTVAKVNLLKTLEKKNSKASKMMMYSSENNVSLV